MALISCPECNKQVSDAAYSCPQCGYALKSASSVIYQRPISIKTEQPWKNLKIAGAIVLFIFSFLSMAGYDVFNGNMSLSWLFSESKALLWFVLLMGAVLATALGVKFKIATIFAIPLSVISGFWAIGNYMSELGDKYAYGIKLSSAVLSGIGYYKVQGCRIIMCITAIFVIIVCSISLAKQDYK